MLGTNVVDVSFAFLLFVLRKSTPEPQIRAHFFADRVNDLSQAILRTAKTRILWLYLCRSPIVPNPFYHH